LFANWAEFQEPITTIAKTIESSGCQRIGLRIDSHDKEYLFWETLRAPDKEMRIESLLSHPGLEKYLDPSFKPCAVICTICGGRTQAYGLELRYNQGNLSLFMGEGFSHDLDN
jgi:hypothetical protein